MIQYLSHRLKLTENPPAEIEIESLQGAEFELHQIILTSLQHTPVTAQIEVERNGKYEPLLSIACSQEKPFEQLTLALPYKVVIGERLRIRASGPFGQAAILTIVGKRLA